MLPKNNLKKAISLIILISFSGIFIFGISSAEALTNPIEAFTKKVDHVVTTWSFQAAISIIGYVSYAIFWLLNRVLLLAANLVDWVFSISTFSDIALVEEGWRITRDLANMFFILIMLTIAFGTILGIESYGVKRVLPKLLVSALLINFSKVIAIVLIDLSQAITFFFLHNGIEGESIAAGIAEGLHLQNFYQRQAMSGIEETFGVGLNATIAVVANLLLGIAFILGATFSFFAMAALMLIRVITLWVLIILAPLAWLAMILQDTKKHWDRWWQEFNKNLLFAPVYAFFLYLGLLMIGKGSGFYNSISAAFNPAKITGLWSALAADANLFIDYIITIAFILFGLFVAKEMGVRGSDAMMKAGGKFKDYALKGSGLIGAGAANLMGRGLRKIPGLEKLPKVSEMKQAVMTTLESIPIFGRMLGGPGAYIAKQKAKVEDERKKREKRPTDTIKEEAKMGVFTPESMKIRTANLEILAERGELGDEFKKFIKDAVPAGLDVKKVLQARPDFALDPELGLEKDIYEDIINKMKPEDAKKIQPEALRNKVVQEAITEALKEGNWTSSHLGKLASEDPALSEEIKRTIIDPNRGNFKKSVEDYLRNAPGLALFGEKEAIPAPTLTPTKKAFQDTEIKIAKNFKQRREIIKNAEEGKISEEDLKERLKQVKTDQEELYQERAKLQKKLEKEEREVQKRKEGIKKIINELGKSAK